METIVCPRCEGEKYVSTGPVVGGMSMTKKCPRCNGSGEIVIEKKEHSHFEPTDLRK